MPISPNVLILEDEPLIALSIEDVVRDMGYEPVVALGLEQALEIAANGDIRLAILDYSIHNQSSEGVAASLKLRQIPFAISSGSDQGVNSPALVGVPHLRKPYADAQLQQTIRQLAGG